MGQRIGVIGGGQLAWMMGSAARKLGLTLVVQTPQFSDPAVGVAADTVLGAIADAQVTTRLAQICDVITFENEFVDLEALTHLEQQGVVFRPRLSALKPLLDKYHQRQFLRDQGIPTPDFSALGPSFDSRGCNHNDWLDGLVFPLVLKARRHGYDGQGTHILHALTDLKTVVQQQPSVDWMLEAFVPFDRELAVMAARFADGTVVVYPLVETQQEQQVCRRVLVLPSTLEPNIVKQAEAIAQTVLQQLNVVGIFGFEFFLTHDGRLLVNEIAPRTHNSGHYTLDACKTSQFEQQLRAVAERSPGAINMTCAGAVMVNLLGFELAQADYLQQRHALEAIPNAHLYWYGKAQSRPGRKLGHLTVRLKGDERSSLRHEAETIAHQIEAIWYP